MWPSFRGESALGKCLIIMSFAAQQYNASRSALQINLSPPAPSALIFPPSHPARGRVATEPSWGKGVAPGWSAFGAGRPGGVRTLARRRVRFRALRPAKPKRAAGRDPSPMPCRAGAADRLSTQADRKAVG